MQRPAETSLLAAQERGRKIRLMQLAPELLAELQRSLEDRLGDKAGEYLYSAACAWAAGEVRRLKSALPEESVELAGTFCQILSGWGWGNWSVQTFEPQTGVVRVGVADSPLAKCYGASDSAVCHLLAGATAGMAEGLLGAPANASELMCLAKGDGQCLFEARAVLQAGEEGWSW